LPDGEISSKISGNQGLNPEEAAPPDSFLPSFRPAIAELTNRNGKVCFMKTKTSPTTESMNRSARHCGTVAALLIPLALACFALSPQARAVCQEGCLPNENTVLGEDALLNNTGTDNTAIGFNALFGNTGGSFNTSTGVESLYSNTSGSSNTATGFQALYLNNGGSNTATGIFAMYNNTTGGDNCAFGTRALNNNTTANNNTAVGTLALVNNTVGSNNIALGYFAGAHIKTGNSNIEIGNRGLAADSHTIRIGIQETHNTTYIAGISGVTVPSGVGVIIGTDGKLGTVVSSERFKTETRPMDKASEAILALKPVTFRYKHELDPDGIPQFGLVAEDVEKVNPDLVARDEQGKPYTVRYEAVNAMLLNEFLKEHRKNEDQQATIARLEKQVEALTAGLQKVSAQLELSKSAPQTVLNDH
jgi:Chaperone of endosialidase